MRKIYLIRHSQPDFPNGRKMCIGKTDISLGEVGRMQSILLAEGMKEKNISLYQLIKKYGISTGQLDRLRKNQNVNSSTMNTLCEILDCRLEDIAEYKK